LKCDAELLKAVNKYFCHSILIDVMWRRRRTATALPCLKVLSKSEISILVEIG